MKIIGTVEVIVDRTASSMLFDNYFPDLAGIEVIEGEFVAITRDGTRTPITDFLERIRRAFDMDVVYVSQFMNGQRVIRSVAADPNDAFSVPVGASDPLEESYCHRVVEGRLQPVIPDTSSVPQAMAMKATHSHRVGSHLAAAVTSKEGRVFGTVCAFSHAPKPELNERGELAALESVAAMLAQALGREK